jgi:hypothetical protein
VAWKECYDGTRKPPMTTIANQVASGLMFAPIAMTQPKLTSLDQLHMSKWLSISSDLAASHPKKLTEVTFDLPPDTEQSSAYQKLTVDLSIFRLHARRSNAIEKGGECDDTDGEKRKRQISHVCRCQLHAARR